MIEHLGINTPYFGILVSLIPFVIATYFYKKTNGFFLLAPLFVSMVAGIAFLKLTGISYENYKIGGDIINFFPRTSYNMLCDSFISQARSIKKGIGYKYLVV